MNKSVIKTRDRAFHWTSKDRIRVKGFIFTVDNIFLEKEQLVDYFEAARNSLDFIDLLKAASGNFAVIIENEDETWMGVDLIRSMPLFYTFREGGWKLADEASDLLKESTSAPINREAELEFLGTGYVTREETLIEGIFQVRPGHAVILGEKAESVLYHSYRTEKLNVAPYQELKASAVRMMEESFQKLVESLAGREAVIPLSGGFDSRFIAVMLKKANYEKVTCFTYGRPGNEEAEISKKVADRLGYKWHFVSYSDLDLDRFYEDKDFKAYAPYAANFSSMFFLQEYFALKFLKEEGLVERDAIFIPGHSGDFLGGSQFAKHGFHFEKEPKEAIVDRILKVKYQYWKYTGKEKKKLKERINQSLSSLDGGSSTALAWSIQEDWDVKEKLSKFNANSVAIYTFFGYEFRLPYWEKNMVNFFRDLPMEAKWGKKLYDEILEEEYFKKFDVSFEKELHIDAKAFRLGRIKKRVKSLLPQGFVNLFTQKLDPLCYYEITMELRKDMKSRGHKLKNNGNRYNKNIIQWYLHQVNLHEEK